MDAQTASLIANVIGIVTLGLAALVLGLIAGAIIWGMLRGTAQAQIANLLCETTADGQPGKPSVSRLQMLIWNFVVAFAFLYILGSTEKVTDIKSALEGLFQLPVLGLLGISNLTYLAGKKITPGTAAGGTETDAQAAQRGGQPISAAEGPGPQGKQ